jgi:hypothetical protein
VRGFARAWIACGRLPSGPGLRGLRKNTVHAANDNARGSAQSLQRVILLTTSPQTLLD